MAFSLTLLVLVFLSSISAACAGEGTQTSCNNDAACFWIPGECKALTTSDCPVTSCPAACVYTPEDPATCVDTQAVTCAADGTTCTTDTANCEESSGTCSLTNPPICTLTGTTCEPVGCSLVDTKACVPLTYGDPCTSLETVLVTSCENNSESFCKLNGAACVPDGSFYQTFCPTLLPENCVAGSDGICVVNGGACTFDLNLACNALGEAGECPEGFCKVSGSNCVEDYTAYCNLFSTTPYSECSNDKRCKVDGTDCLQKTPVEFCATWSTAATNKCEYYGCEISGTGCIEGKKGSPSCTDYSVEESVIPCTENKCVIDGGGNCVAYEPNCRLDNAGTACDSSILSGHCELDIAYSCSVDNNCPAQTSQGNCDDEPGCTWSTTGTCVTKNALNCPVDSNAGCAVGAPAGCTSNPGTRVSCVPNPAIDDATCSPNTLSYACNQVSGCKWSNTGGTCVDKNCTNSASYTLCCPSGASCTYCAGNPRPVDCPNACTTTPSYANCCPDASCAYCATDPKPGDCPPSSSPPDAGFKVYAPVLFLIALLFVKWF